MAYTVQDDTGTVVGANTYETVAFYRQYNSERGRAVIAQTDEEIQAAGIRATTYMDSRWTYLGIRAAEGQTTQFPRTDLTDADDREVTGIPLAVKQAWAEYAWLATTIADLNEPANTTGRSTTYERKKLGSLEKEFRYTPGSTRAKYPQADRILKASGFIDLQMGRAG